MLFFLANLCIANPMVGLCKFVKFSFTHIHIIVGVSLKFQGATIPNDSLVNIHDLLYTTPYPPENIIPTNSRPDLHDRALLCETDLTDCCDSPWTVRGDWYYPDGRAVPFYGYSFAFRANRGPNEVRNGRQFYGSIRLFSQFSNPPEKGRFRCELPSAGDPSANQTLYVNICRFKFGNNVPLSHLFYFPQ